MKYNLHSKIIWHFLSKDFKNEIKHYYDNETTKNVIKKAKTNYKEIISRTSYTGGIKNPYTTNILTAAVVVSIYKSEENLIKPSEMERILYNVFKNSTKIKKYIRFKYKKSFTPEWQLKMNNISKKSRIRKYKGDFVSEFIHGPSINEYGLNFYECGVCKLFNQEKVMELAPYMCKLDFIIAPYMNAYIKRTQTIVNGDKLCNFWYTNKDK